MHPLTEVWWRLFVNRTDGTIRRGRDGWIYTPARLTIHEVDAALRGQVSLGVYAVDQGGLSRWLCLDADSEPGLLFLVELAVGLNPASTVLEVSRRGGHLWWLCPPTPWQVVQGIGQSLSERRSDIEVFPKGPGRNGVRLPRTPHPRTNEVYPIVDATTGEVRPVDVLRSLRAEPLPQRSLPDIYHEPKRWPVGHGDFAELLAEVERFTSVRVYAPERAVGRCPFHDDHRPSLSLLGGFWRCWAGCGEGGLQAFRARVRQHRLEVIADAVSTAQ